MKKIIFYFATVLFCTSAICGQVGIMYEINNEAGTAYLVGTNHLRSDRFFPLPSYIEEKILDSQKFAIENLPIKAVSVFEARDIASVPKGQRTRDFFAKVADDSVVKGLIFGFLFQKSQAIRDFYLDAHPIFIAEKLKVPGMPLIETDKMALDEYFVKQAENLKIPIEELEGWRFRDQFKKKNSPEETWNYIEKFGERFYLSTDYSKKVVDIVERIDSCFEAGDVEAIYKLNEYMGVELLGQTQRAQRLLVEERNMLMAEKIAGFLASGNRYFIVVGAAHLGGDEGILNLLAKKGIRIKRVIEDKQGTAKASKCIATHVPLYDSPN